MAKKDTTKQKQTALSKRFTQTPYFLEHIKMTSFGRFANIIVGPFGPGMNVVYGPNEAGKTTLNELVKGVLFGWPAARGETNPYRPENAERAGSLFFKNTSTGDVVELKRVKNSDELEPPAPLMTNIDQETYETMFSLTSDELLRLDRHSDITARLLTAGSGTSSSPAHALETINKKIKTLTSRSAQNPESIGNLKAEQARLRTLVREGREEADALREQEAILASLHPRSVVLGKTQERLNAEIENLNKAVTQLHALDETIEVLEKEVSPHGGSPSGATQNESESYRVPVPNEEIAPVAHLSQNEEYCLRDVLEDFDEHRSKLEHALDNARNAAHASRVAYELHVEDGRLQQQYERARKQRWVRLIMAVVIPLLLAAIGAYIVLHARTSSSYLVMGVLLVVVALVLALVGIAISVKPTQTEEEWEDSRTKKEWVMQQDAKSLEVREQELQEYLAYIKQYLDDQGLGAAEGSIRRARRLLDEVRSYRSACELADQSHQAALLRRANQERELHAAREQRVQVCQQYGFDPEAFVEEFEERIERKSAERTKTAQIAAETERQIGEISERLAAARRGMSFDELKLENETVETRLADDYRQLAVLLLAKRSLEEAIAQWERKSQPEVYRCASYLFEQMTEGAWQSVRMNPQGDIEVVDAIKTTRAPHLLSLGTRQQLYLSLRIALLMTAENVGRGLPIMCDDILVNFDDKRRVQAVRALAQLAQKRQVILFTCHPDIASLVSKVDSKSKLIEL